MCDSKELLVSFLYGELEPGETDRFQAHLAQCAECRADVEGLRSTQRHLAAWSPPEPDLGFQIIRAPATPISAPRPVWGGTWGLAAAATLVLATGAAIANVDMRYGADGLTLRTGWRSSAPSANVLPTSASAASVRTETVDWKAQAQALDLRVRQLEASLNAGNGAVPARADAGTDAVLRRVSELVAQSESRQQRAVVAHLDRLSQDIDARRKVDLSLIDQGLMRLQTTSDAELRQSRDLMQRMYRATAYQPR